MREAKRIWRKANPELVREQRQERYWKNPEREREQNRLWRDANPGWSSAKERRRRARKALVESEPYTLAAVAEADGFECVLCERPVDMTKTVPHPLAPTVDHALPISLGGPDTWDNVQLAHFVCNSAKGNRFALPLAYYQRLTADLA